jgi:hypothetical protein
MVVKNAFFTSGLLLSNFVAATRGLFRTRSSALQNNSRQIRDTMLALLRSETKAGYSILFP